MRNKSKVGKKKITTSHSKKATRRRKSLPRTRENLSAQMTNYLLEPHPEIGA
ncbi:MAG: hypothetical protein WB995_16135 [Candidatus Acidiferrales bacterium]